MKKKHKMIGVLLISIIAVVGVVSIFIGIFYPKKADHYGINAAMLTDIKQITVNSVPSAGPEFANMPLNDWSLVQELIIYMRNCRYSIVCFPDLSQSCSISVKTESSDFILYENGIILLDGKYFKIEKQHLSLVHYFIVKIEEQACLEMNEKQETKELN